MLNVALPIILAAEEEAEPAAADNFGIESAGRHH